MSVGICQVSLWATKAVFAGTPSDDNHTENGGTEVNVKKAAEFGKKYAAGSKTGALVLMGQAASVDVTARVKVENITRKMRNAAGAVISGGMKKLIGKLDKRVTGGEKDFKVSFGSAIPFSFQWPYRPFKLTGGSQWNLHDFIFLSNTKTTFRVKYEAGKEPNVVLRKVSISFSGASRLNKGFWGVVTDYKQDSFPGMRTDRIEFTEAFDKATGRPIRDHYSIERGGETRKVSYSIQYWVSFHDKKTGKTTTSALKGALIKHYGGMEVKYQGHTAYRMDLTGQLYGTFNEFGKMAGIVKKSKGEYVRMVKKGKGLKTRSAGQNLVLSMWYLWTMGIFRFRSPSGVDRAIKMSPGRVERRLGGKINQMETKL
jgi:hypothetical protein